MAIRQASVIVCTYNRGALLPRVLSQMRAQNYPSNAFEIILVDNGSTDETRIVVERLNTETGLPVKYVFESRSGITFARNRGAQESRFPYLVYVDDDCSVNSDWLMQLMSAFDLDERVGVVGGQIIVDFEHQKKPSWLGQKSERWLGAYNHPGSQTRLLENPTYICEGNMAMTRHALEKVGGFFGMDMFNSPHIASQEIIYLLEKVKNIGEKVAFNPKAIVYHHPEVPTIRWMVSRVFWNGVSAGILEHILHRRTWIIKAYQVLLNVAASFTFFFLAMVSLLIFDKAGAMYQLLRAIRRIGLILSELHLVGDWRQVRTWVSEQG